MGYVCPKTLKNMPRTNFQSGPIWQSIYPYQTSFEAISDQFRSHIGPVSKPYRTTLSAASVAAAVDDDVMVEARWWRLDSMNYKDHLY